MSSEWQTFPTIFILKKFVFVPVNFNDWKWGFLGIFPFYRYQLFSFIGMCNFYQKSSKSDRSNNLGQAVVKIMILADFFLLSSSWRNRINSIYMYCRSLLISYETLLFISQYISKTWPDLCLYNFITLYFTYLAYNTLIYTQIQIICYKYLEAVST